MDFIRKEKPTTLLRAFSPYSYSSTYEEDTGNISIILIWGIVCLLNRAHSIPIRVSDAKTLLNLFGTHSRKKPILLSVGYSLECHPAEGFGSINTRIPPHIKYFPQKINSLLYSREDPNPWIGPTSFRSKQSQDSRSQVEDTPASEDDKKWILGRRNCSSYRSWLTTMRLKTSPSRHTASLFLSFGNVSRQIHNNETQKGSFHSTDLQLKLYDDDETLNGLDWFVDFGKTMQLSFEDLHAAAATAGGGGRKQPPRGKRLLRTCPEIQRWQWSNGDNERGGGSGYGGLL